MPLKLIYSGLYFIGIEIAIGIEIEFCLHISISIAIPISIWIIQPTMEIMEGYQPSPE